jgi:hypothetical protein
MKPLRVSALTLVVLLPSLFQAQKVRRIRRFFSHESRDLHWGVLSPAGRATRRLDQRSGDALRGHDARAADRRRTDTAVQRAPVLRSLSLFALVG